MKNLLNKPLRAFGIYSFIVLLCSIPAYFFIVDLIWIHEVDEHNKIRSEAIKQNLAALKLDDKNLEKHIQLWNKLQPETRILSVTKLQPDSTYNIYRKNKYLPGNGYDRFEGLVSYFKLNGRYYSITLETNVEESYETIFAITAVTGLFFLILLTGFILLNKRISKKLWNPFYQSLQKIRSFELSSQRLPDFEKTGIAEFEEMNKSILRLIGGNIDVYKQQKEFTENASHELQTPLAIVQSKLDLLLQSSILSEKQSGIINEASYALRRVSRINKNLLTLAKIENLQFSNQEQIFLSEELHAHISLLEDFLISKKLKLKKEILPGVVIDGNKLLTELLLTNLMMNAIRHNILNGEIHVFLGTNLLTVSNSGSDFLNTDKLFKRFSTASSENPGSGLGLAIVQEICNRQGWIINYSFKNNFHVFSVSF